MMKQKIDASLITMWLIHTFDKDFTSNNNKGFNGDTNIGLFLKMNIAIPNSFMFCKPLEDVTKLLTPNTVVLAVPKDVFRDHFTVLANFTFCCN